MGAVEKRKGFISFDAKSGDWAMQRIRDCFALAGEHREEPAASRGRACNTVERRRKQGVVMRLLRGESLDFLARECGGPPLSVLAFSDSYREISELTVALDQYQRRHRYTKVNRCVAENTGDCRSWRVKPSLTPGCRREQTSDARGP